MPRTTKCLCGGFGVIVSAEPMMGQHVPLSRLPASVRRTMEQRRVFRGKPSAWMVLIRYLPGRVTPGLVSITISDPTCGTTVCWTRETGSTRFGIPVGLFNEPSFPAPPLSVWEKRRYEGSPAIENVTHWDTQPLPR